MGFVFWGIIIVALVGMPPQRGWRLTHALVIGINAVGVYIFF